MRDYEAQLATTVLILEEEAEMAERAAKLADEDADR